MSSALPAIPREVRTSRLLLRAPRSEDAQSVHAAVHASLPELRPWMVWAQDPLDLPGTAENLTRAAEAFTAGENLRYLVWNAAGTKLVGSSGYHALDWRVPKGEIGYWIATAHAGQGYATEVARALTELALWPQVEGGLGFRRLEIRCDARNDRSARIPARLGYTLDAVLKNDDVAADDPMQLRDTLIFSMTR
ncbi:GNAT family N-acetyltransferase [Deinococcus hopiensis]|uniref:Protein N-acetyltransferase, RimJ/RimL family n=1 Tax=Deinococcus hopiensis KR-140 TaxID=695939 RepID=A0A1W1UKT9_9DEIO|nr:GNAT family N-acetyltransferase [Deinococcus hopiensis]SMB81411.1 Protein N-acetyltransferase, RimJ/RimL family [Deinococcus hopiensis KR-140]